MFHVKYPLFLSVFNQVIFSIDIKKNPQISNFMKICPVADKYFHAGKQMDGQMETMKLIITFCNFANVPKNGLLYIVDCVTL
jgi:hypothetical protein